MGLIRAARRVRRAAGRAVGRVREFTRGGLPTHRPVRRVGVIAATAGIAAVLLGVLWVGGRTIVTVVVLQQAQGDVRTFAYRVQHSQTPSSTQLQQDVRGATRLAASASGDPVWRFAEHVPLVGPNLRALRQTSQVLDGLVAAAKPLAVSAEGLSLASLKGSSAGGVGIEPLKTMPGPYADFDRGLRVAATEARTIPTGGVLPVLADQVTELRSGLTAALPASAWVRRVLPIAYSALGGSSRRYYLLMFQNNAEERASGGNPAAIALLKVYQGKLTLDRQLNSSEFPHPFPEAVRSYGAAYDKLYGPHVGRYVTNTTFTPDFPTTASLTRTMWQKVTDGGTVDGVISFDPVALSYLLRATGSITLQGGDVITSKNAVSFLLSDVYKLHPNVKVQNQVFSSAAVTIFQAVTKGQGGFAKYFDQLPQIVDEQRLKMWSIRDSEESLLLQSPLGTMLPASNTPATTLGVYNNDDATSKMSYYLNNTIAVQADVCRATPKYTVTTAVTNTLSTQAAKSVSDFVLAHQKDIPFAGDRQWVQLFGPVGAKLQSVTIDGKKVVWGTDIEADRNTNPDATGVDIRRPAVKDRIYGRPVGIVSITIPSKQTVTVKAVFTGGTTPAARIAVSHTPRVRAVPVRIRTTPCG